MREVFAPQETTPKPEPVFYTILRADIGKTVIKTEIGPIHLDHFLGRVQSIDVGKRLYFTPRDGYPGGGIWTAENDGQRLVRQNRERRS